MKETTEVTEVTEQKPRRGKVMDGESSVFIRHSEHPRNPG
jgi:hypothetical protein